MNPVNHLVTMNYKLTKDKTEHYNTNVDKVETYIKKIEPLITTLFQRERKEYVHEPTMFGDNSEENIKGLKEAHKQRQKQMIEGYVGQLIIGNWFGWEDLKKGHSTGLDCRKEDNSIILEVKNKYNTISGGSTEKGLLDKLSKYKKENPQTRCVWAIINPKPRSKNLCKKIIHNGVEIEKIQGDELFALVFRIGNIDYSTQVINMVKDIIRKIN